MIYLAMVPPNGPEIHINWRGHKTTETAEQEMLELRKIMYKRNQLPMDYYIYEAELPTSGKAYELDDVDMNFYEERTPDSIAQEKKRMEELLAKVKTLADEEKKKYGQP